MHCFAFALIDACRLRAFLAGYPDKFFSFHSLRSGMAHSWTGFFLFYLFYFFSVGTSLTSRTFRFPMFRIAPRRREQGKDFFFSGILCFCCWLDSLRQKYALVLFKAFRLFNILFSSLFFFFFAVQMQYVKQSVTKNIVCNNLLEGQGK